jgi:hypothetical protein
MCMNLPSKTLDGSIEKIVQGGRCADKMASSARWGVIHDKPHLSPVSFFTKSNLSMWSC